MTMTLMNGLGKMEGTLKTGVSHSIRRRGNRRINLDMHRFPIIVAAVLVPRTEGEKQKQDIWLIQSN